MIATFTPDGGSLITLAGADAGHFDQPTGGAMEAAGSIQVTPLVRGAAPDRRHRGNVSFTYSFSVEKNFDHGTTYDDVIASNVALIQSVTAALGVFYLKTDAGGTLLTLTSADVRVSCPAPQGVVARRDFTITGIID
jgi:hypothetical protein